MNFYKGGPNVGAVASYTMRDFQPSNRANIRQISNLN